MLLKDPWGLVCILLTYILLLHYLCVSLISVVFRYFSESFYGTAHALTICTLLILLLASHYRAAFSDPGFVPLPKKSIDFSDIQSYEHRAQQNLNGWTVCERCDNYKPVQSNHCRICKRCVRKLLHHCSGINNCIGELNQKYFILFLFYIELMSVHAFWLMSWVLVNFSANSKILFIQWLFIFAESVFFGLVAFILLLDQIRGIFSDRTSTDKIKFENQSLPVTRQSSNKIFLLRRTFGNGPTWLWIFPCDFNFYKSDEEVQKMFNI